MNTLDFSTLWLFKLGDGVKDAVTGFKGTITTRIEYLNGCKQYCVEPKIDKDGQIQKKHYIDESQLILVEARKKRKIKIKNSHPGGDMPNAPDKVK